MCEEQAPPRGAGSFSRSHGSLLLEPSSNIDLFVSILDFIRYLLSTPAGGLRLISGLRPSRLVYRGIKTFMPDTLSSLDHTANEDSAYA